jgi:hypothetical protein
MLLPVFIIILPAHEKFNIVNEAGQKFLLLPLLGNQL